MVSVLPCSIPCTLHLFSIISHSSSDLWILVLSITMTDFFCGHGFIWSSTPLVNALNIKAVKGQSNISNAIIPSSDKAGRIEYLPQYIATCVSKKGTEITFSLPRVKKSCLLAWFPNSNGCPSIWLAWHMLVKGTFVHKHQLLWFVVCSYD